MWIKRLLSLSREQVEQLLNPKEARPKGQLPSHAEMEDFLGRYCGLMLFVKEIDQARYGQICSVRPQSFPFLHPSVLYVFRSWVVVSIGRCRRLTLLVFSYALQAYFTEMSGLHKHEIQELMGVLKGQVRKASDDELEASTSSVLPSFFLCLRERKLIADLRLLVQPSPPKTRQQCDSSQ
jgi:hypothetical protein